MTKFIGDLGNNFMAGFFKRALNPMMLGFATVISLIGTVATGAAFLFIIGTFAGLGRIGKKII